MTVFDTIIRGGTIATASDTFRCDVGIRGGRIAALGENLGGAKDIVDAQGLLVLPGGIDSHVHIAQPSGPGIVMADDFASGTRSAAFGGNTMVLPFAMQQKGESLREVVKAYHAKAEGQCYVDVSFHLIVADANERVLGQELPALVHDGYTSFKVFMTYEGLALSDMEMLKVMSVARETGAMVMPGPEGCERCTWLSMPPGSTSLPLASTISDASPRFVPSAVMVPPVMPMSQENVSAAVAIVPPRMIVSNAMLCLVSARY